MRVRYTTWSVLALLLGSVAMGYGARLPRNGDGNSSTTSTAKSARAAKIAPKKRAAAGVHSTRTSSTAKRRVVRHTVVHAQMAPTPSRISEIQAALSKEGAYQGEPNGQWDTATVDAMRQFQNAHGLTPTGKIDALTLQKLGLGSQVSGMGAPLPLAMPQASAVDGGGQTEHP